MGKPKPATNPGTKPSGKGAVFARRATSTIVLWVLIGTAIAFESVPFLSVLVMLVCVLACAEFLGLLGLKGTPGWSGVCLVSLICAAGHLGSFLMPFGLGYFAFALTAPVLFIGVSAVLLFHPIAPERTARMFMGSVFGVLYTAVLGAYMLRILTGEADYLRAFGGPDHPVSGIYYLLFVLAATKFADMGAYIVGTAIGKRKFIPHISPGKTWEGILLGAFPFAILGGVLIYQFFGDKMPLLGWPSALFVSALLGAVAIVGDLAESVLKRCLAKKDSGSFLPGIGGVLDLVDSVLFAAPVMYFYLLFAATYGNN